MASSARIDEIKKKFDENPRRYFAPLANEFRKAGDLEQAILICEEFLPQQAGHMSGHIVYGQALFESGRLPESRTVFETALGLDPENLIALRHLGDIARAEGDPSGARRWYDRVLEADPRNEEIRTLLAGLDADGLSAPSSAPAPPAEIEPIHLDMDDAGFSAPAPPEAAPAAAPELPAAPPAPPAAHAAGRAEGLEPSEFEPPTAPLARAEGLEPAEFEAPTGVAPRAEGLETTAFSAPAPESTDRSLLDLEDSFDLPGATSAPVAPPPGLEQPVAAPTTAADEPAFPSLDLDEGLAVPGQALPAADVPLGEAAPRGAENPRMEPPAAMEAMPALSLGAPDASAEAAPAAAPAEPVLELPPSVIAAESALMNVGVDLDDAFAGEPPASGTGRQAPFVTETMAELYLSQGFHAQALDVYRQLAASSPGDARLRERVATLERGAYDDAPSASAGASPSVREFFFRLATRRPGEGSLAAAPPAPDDFSSFEAIPEKPTRAPDTEPRDDSPTGDAPLPFMDASEPDTPSSSVELPFLDVEPGPAPVPAPAPESPPAAEAAPAPASMPTPSERATKAQGGGGNPAPGTIDALFGTRATATSEDSAAAALAQAFGGAAEAPVIAGRPARAASAELSLDSVFRDGPPRPPRPSQSFSFDQFFSEGASDAAPGKPSASAEAGGPGEPAERSADDVKQFNSWLQGLKPQ